MCHFPSVNWSLNAYDKNNPSNLYMLLDQKNIRTWLPRHIIDVSQTSALYLFRVPVSTLPNGPSDLALIFSGVIGANFRGRNRIGYPPTTVLSSRIFYCSSSSSPYATKKKWSVTIALVFLNCLADRIRASNWQLLYINMVHNLNSNFIPLCLSLINTRILLCRT